MPTMEEKNRFQSEVEQLVSEKGVSHLEAIILYCETTGLEMELAVTLINMQLKGLLETEAENLNLIKKSGGKLPL